MKVLLKKEVCGSRKQCMGPIEQPKKPVHVLKKKKKKKGNIERQNTGIETLSKWVYSVS